MDTIYLIPPIFFVIAFVFSMLGLGGSQLYIPVLFWMRLDFKTQAIPLGMLLNVVNSSSAAWTYGKNKLIRWRVAIPFGLSMVLLAPLGTWVNINLPTKPVILIFAVFTAAAAVLMLSGWKPRRGELTRQGKTVLGVSAGGILGFFAGLIGRGGGSFVVPLLYIAGLEAKVAAATSAMVITFSGISSFLSHIFTAAQPDWLVWGLSVASVFLGSQAGSRLMAGRLKSGAVKIIFGGGAAGSSCSSHRKGCDIGRFEVDGEWYVVGEFHSSEENSTRGKLGDIRGRPNQQDVDTHGQARGTL